MNIIIYINQVLHTTLRSPRTGFSFVGDTKEGIQQRSSPVSTCVAQTIVTVTIAWPWPSVLFPCMQVLACMPLYTVTRVWYYYSC
jgi:hypothetical protein